MEELSKAVQGLAAAVISIAVAASVAYETGYFSIVGKKYQGVLSASDYLSSALEWLPWLSLYYGIGLLLARVGSFRLMRIAKRTLRNRPFVIVVLAVLVLAGVVLLIALVPFYLILQYTPLAILPVIAAPLFIQLSQTAGSARKLTLIAASSIAVMLALYLSGIGQAHHDISIIDNAYVLKSGTNVEGDQILRTLQKGLLVWRPQDNKVEFVGWERIERTTHLIWKSYDAPWLEPLGCKIWSGICRRPPAPTP